MYIFIWNRLYLSKTCFLNDNLKNYAIDSKLFILSAKFLLLNENDIPNFQIDKLLQTRNHKIIKIS